MSASGGCRSRKSLATMLNKKREGRTGTASSGGALQQPRARMMDPDAVDEAWKALLEETLPPDKQEVLNQTFEDEKDPQMRYNMLLEFSSYLRQVCCPAENQLLQE